jgi:hypothetical protein
VALPQRRNMRQTNCSPAKLTNSANELLSEAIRVEKTLKGLLAEVVELVADTKRLMLELTQVTVLSGKKTIE